MAAMDSEALLRELQDDPAYAGQIVHVQRLPARAGRYAAAGELAALEVADLAARLGVARLYAHQAEVLRLARQGRDVVIATGTASGKTLAYALPILQRLQARPAARALLLYPTKALTQDQFKHFRPALAAAGLGDRLGGVVDGDTPAPLRRRLRAHGAVLFSNPDTVHAVVLPQHARWAEFLAHLEFLVVDELHVYSGSFGSNLALLLRRFLRVCQHYGSRPQILLASATIANPQALAAQLTGRDVALVATDGSPRGARTYVWWNPPRQRATPWRARRSANVEAHELMARLVARGIPTITFSKARMTAEMIHRYVTETLRRTAPALAGRVTPYRGGYLATERRAIEQRLFSGDLLGVSTTPALELGIDVGHLDAAILVGYPGTRASFFQQAGRAGRQARPALAFLVGLDTAINQFIMSHPEYLFARAVEEAVLDPENPFVVLGHLRCAAHELPLDAAAVAAFGPAAPLALRVLAANLKLREVDGRWYHAATETPQFEVSLRSYDEANVVIRAADTGATLGEVTRLDAPALVHPDAIYLHRGDTYRVLTLDLEKNVAVVRREDVDYYTQALGGTDVHHIDRQLRAKPFGTGTACWGEVTAYFSTPAFEKIRFYELDALSRHGLHLPTMALETQACWLVLPEPLLERVRRAGFDVYHGLRGIGYATRMILPLFITADTLDFSHSVGSANSPWQALFVYERFPHGLGFTAKAYDRLHAILPAVLAAICACPCADGCPCCVGKPLRQATTWNVERGEGSIPSKAAARLLLEGYLGDGANLTAPDTQTLADTPAGQEQRLEQALRRRLERPREPQVFHPITPAAHVATGYPTPEPAAALATPDVARRVERRRDTERDLQRRLAKKLAAGGLPPTAGKVKLPPEFNPRGGGVARPNAFPGQPAPAPAVSPPAARAPLVGGDPVARRAQQARRQRRPPAPAPPPDGKDSPP